MICEKNAYESSNWEFDRSSITIGKRDSVECEIQRDVNKSRIYGIVFHKFADLDSRLAYPRSRPRLSSFKTKTKTKTLMSKTKTETQDLQDQYWKSMTGIDCDKQKD